MQKATISSTDNKNQKFKFNITPTVTDSTIKMDVEGKVESKGKDATTINSSIVVNSGQKAMVTETNDNGNRILSLQQKPRLLMIQPLRIQLLPVAITKELRFPKSQF